MSKTLIEDLPNESFYEIFEYLDGYEIYQSFSNLNHRFQELLISSSLRLKVTVRNHAYDKLNTDISKQLLVNNKHQILSLKLLLSSYTSDFLSSISLDSSFNQLESLVLSDIRPNILTSFLTNLSSLPRLASLSIRTESRTNDLTPIYQLVFPSPVLKYFQCSANSTYVSLSLPMATDEQITSIEKLVIDHRCPLDNLYSILSYTPELSSLELVDLSESYTNMELTLPFSYCNLTYLSIEICSVTFDMFEMFIIETECNLNVLRLYVASEDKGYLDGYRWEDLIENYLPELEEFSFEYCQTIDPESGSLTDFTPSNPFGSLFWIEHNWFLEIEMGSSDVMYEIGPYKKRWYDDNNSSTDFTKSTRLMLTSFGDGPFMYSFKLTLWDVLSVTQIYHLEISEIIISSNILEELIQHLFELDSLKISSLILSSTTYSAMDEINLRIIANKNPITKVYLEKMNNFEEVYFLMKLCPHVKYFKIDSINNMDIQLFIKNIFTKIKKDRREYLRCLRFHVPRENDEIVQKLEQMIQQENLLRQFSIKCVLDCIDLEWE